MGDARGYPLCRVAPGSPTSGLQKWENEFLLFRLPGLVPESSETGGGLPDQPIPESDVSSPASKAEALSSTGFEDGRVHVCVQVCVPCVQGAGEGCGLGLPGPHGSCSGQGLSKEADPAWLIPGQVLTSGPGILASTPGHRHHYDPG